MSRLKELLLSHPDWIAPRSDEHTVIGIPHSREHRKTFVEPGGSFSPGIATFGVTTWLYDRTHQRFYAPEELPRTELDWSWENGYLPILHNRWSAGACEVAQQLFSNALANTENIVDTCKLTLYNHSSETVQCSLYLVVRPYGPAGGKITTLSVPVSGSMAINGRTALLAEQASSTFGATSYARDQADISVYLRNGRLPGDDAVADDDGLCCGVLAYDLTLAPAEQYELVFDCFVHPLEQDYLETFRRYHRLPYQQKHEQVRQFWQQLLHKVELQVPDERFVNAYYSMLAQFLMATVHHEVRITTLTYPLFWLRDGVYIINALDKAGFHADVRLNLANIQHRIFVGGFGAEPDAFGEGIWAFYTHYQLTRDQDWLKQVYPALQERADWIIRARHTQEYLYADVEMRVPHNRYVAETDLICEPARNGLIIGRMDWHQPLIWINAFAYFGLHAMSKLAEILGHEDETKRYSLEALDLQQALHRYAQEAFGQNERDTVCAIWPTRAFSADDTLIKERFEHWWQAVRLQGRGTYTPEPLWKYFELGQAHNYLFLGEREKMLQTVNYYLDHHDVQQLFGWLEDSYDIAEHWNQIEGWYKQPSRQPHGWVSSEFFLLLRDMLLYEDDDSLVLGAGIPSSWLKPGQRCVVDRFPTSFGQVDLAIECEQRKIIITLHFHTLESLPLQVRVRLPWPAAIVASDYGQIERSDLVVLQEAYREVGALTITVQVEG